LGEVLRGADEKVPAPHRRIENSDREQLVERLVAAQTSRSHVL
jgi:hypothetical protein